VPPTRFIVVGSTVVLLAASCGGGVSAESTPITDLSIEAQVSWEPPEAPDAGTRAAIAAALGPDRPTSQQAGPALLPGPLPAGNGIEGVASAELMVTRTVPTDIVRVDVVVRRADQTVVVSVSAMKEGDAPGCGAPLEQGWMSATIRGSPGCSLQVPGAVSFLRWDESGGTFQAEYGPEVAFDDLVAWLEAWHPPTG
jgi:hypothetical protein